MRKDKLKRVLLCASFFLMVGIFVACAKETEENDKIKNVEVKKTAQREETYNTEIKNLSGNFNRIVDMCEQGEKIYLLADTSEYDVQSGKATESYSLIEVSLQGNEISTVHIELSEGEQVFKIGLDQENRLQILTAISLKNKKGKEKEYIYVKYLETDGSVTNGHELKVKKGQDSAFGGKIVLLAKDGSVYLADMFGTVISYDITGKEQDACDLKGYLEGLVQAGNGTIYAYGALGRKEESAFRELDQEASTFEDPVNTDGYKISSTSVQAGKSGYGLVKVYIVLMRKQEKYKGL